MKTEMTMIVVAVSIIVLAAAREHKEKGEARSRSLKVICGGQPCKNPADLCCSNNVVNGVTNQCYSATTHDCLPDQYLAGKNSLCPTGHYAGCKGICFDTDVYYCDSTGKIQKINVLIKSTTLLSDQNVIKTINVAQDSWSAGANPAFSGKTIADVRILASTKTGASPPRVASVEVRRIRETDNILACTTCLKGDLCCNGRCYNPLTHHCLNGFLCPLKHFRCGNACYLPSQYSCFPGNILCPINTLPCGNACYRATQNECCNNVLRPKGTCPGTIPIAFSSASKWPNCINPIGNQGSCGSCWAFSAAQILGDRYCIVKNLASALALSSQYQVSCDKGNLGCAGGWLDRTWSFLSTTGIPTATCVPYSGTNGLCPLKCYNYYPLVLYKSKLAYQLNGFDNALVQREIMTYGPIHAAFSVYNDFFFYTSGVYKHVTGDFAGGHAVRVVGWGVEAATNKKYWIVANSWGTGWGMNGYFWISRGNNEVGFESNMWRALPV